MSTGRYTQEDLEIFKRNRERGIRGAMIEFEADRQLVRRLGNKAGKVEQLVCDDCGSSDVSVDAVADWNHVQQRFELAEAMPYDKSVFCRSCDATEMHGKWIWIDRPGPLWCCPHCGCTDIQGTAWLDLNTDKPNQDDPPTDDFFCPQCSHEGYEGTFSKGCDRSMIAQPFDATKCYRREEE